MNKKNIILFIILALLIVVLIFSKGRENTEKRLNAFRFNANDVTKIEFVVPNADTLIVEKDRETWRIVYPKDAPVNKTQLDRFFDNYLTLTTSSIPISEDYSKQREFNVDEENATQIILYDINGRLLSHVFMGRSQTNQRIAYIRHENHTQIFQIENMFWFINPTINAWEGEEEVFLPDEEDMDWLNEYEFM